jgi:hypothetical protein
VTYLSGRVSQPGQRCAGQHHVTARTCASACEACRIIPGLVSQ